MNPRRSIALALGLLLSSSGAEQLAFAQEKPVQAPSFNPNQVALLRWYEGNRTEQASVSIASPQTAAFDGDHLWVASFDQLHKVRASDGQNLATYDFADGFDIVSVVFDGHFIWASSGLGGIKKVRADDGSHELTITPNDIAGTVPHGIAFDGRHLWIAGIDGALAKARPRDGLVHDIYYTGASRCLFVAFDGAHIWVTCPDSHFVAKLRRSDGALLGTFATGVEPHGLAFDGRSMWVANKVDGTVSKLALNGAEIGTYPSGGGADSVAFDGTSIWVSNEYDSTVTKLRARDGLSRGLFTVGVDPRGLTFDGANMWVMNFATNTLQRL